MSKINKARFWTAVLYPENMRKDWEIEIGDILQYPYAYCKHFCDKDLKSEHRKDHVHIILVFPNTTTYNHAMSVFDLLSADGKKALNKIEACVSIRRMYDYLIHDTETCRKQGKELYNASERITGNSFDIGSYEQLGIAERNEMFLEMCEAIRKNGFTNYMDFYEYVVDTYESMNYIEIMRCCSSHFERLTKGNYQKLEQERCNFSVRPSQAQHHENTTEFSLNFCPNCGSVNIIKSGKTAANSQRWACKDCGKKFV